MTEPFHLLQINIISARDLAPVCGPMSTYAIGWVDPERKQTTRVDHKGNNCPEWNDKFVFRVTPGFLKSEATTFVVEIYTQAWLRDVVVGSVRVSIASLIPAPNPKGTARRAVALQIRRPSGRPQGILNVGVSVMDGTLRSMPLSGLDVPDARPKPDPVQGAMRRVKSERSWTAADVDEHRQTPNPPPMHETNGPMTRPASSLGGSLCTDVGPSPSVVAAAVAKGLYLPASVAKAATQGRRGKKNDDAESSILQWEDEQSEEGVMSKIERWKTELHHPMTMYGKDSGLNGSGLRYNKRGGHRRSKTEAGRLFRCFGKVCGFEFTIVCGGDNKKDRHHDKDNGSIIL